MTIAPPRGFCAAIRRAAARLAKKTPSTFARITAAHAASEVRAALPRLMTPALFTSKSIRPHRRAAVATARSHTFESPTSPATNKVSVGNSAQARRSFASSRPTSKIRACSRASNSQTARPTPEPPPVTTAAAPRKDAAAPRFVIAKSQPRQRQPRRAPAVENINLAADKRRFVARKPQRERGDIVRVSDAPDRMQGANLGARFVRARVAGD